MIEILFDPFSTLELCSDSLGSEACIYLPLLLDCGQAYADMSASEHMSLLETLTRPFEEDEDYLQERLNQYKQAHQDVLHACQQGKAMRLWISHSAETQCGLRYLCSLAGSQTEMHVVMLEDSEGAQYARWQEVLPMQIQKFVANDRILTTQEIETYADEWQQFVEENSKLRAMVDGKVTDVEETYYDAKLLQMLLEGPKDITTLWASLPETLDLAFINDRMDQLVEQGKVRIMEENDNPPMRVVVLVPQEDLF